MFSNASSGPGLGTEEQRIMREEAREGAAVLAAQREREKEQVEKEEGEMLRALMGDYQVEDLFAAATEGRVARKGKGKRGKGTSKPAFQQVAVGSRVQKKEKESELDFFRHSKRAMEKKRGEELEERGAVMELDDKESSQRTEITGSILV